MLNYLFGSKGDDWDFKNPKEFRAGEDDCMSCKALGTISMVTLGGYTYHTGMKNLQAQRAVIEASKSKYKYGSRQLGILLISGSLVSAGLYRAFN